MTLTVSPWVVWALLCLTLFGVVFLLRLAWHGVRDVRVWVLIRWYRRRRGQPNDVSDDCWFNAHEDCDGCECDRCDCSAPLEELPPERSWEELTEDRPAPALVRAFDRLRDLEAVRERRAPKWEAEARSHYVAMGLDYPSGLVARVREAAP